MATIEATLPRSGALGRGARRRPAGADDPRREGRPARLVLGVRGRRPSPGSTRHGWPPSPPTASARSPGWRARPTCARSRWPRTANAIQRYLVEGTRLGIPAIIHEECLHGLIAWEAPCFQQSIGAAASFDPDVVAATAATIRRRMLLTGARHALAPVLDIGRDPRWGRIEETYGEDPYLAAVLGCAYIEALQGPDLVRGRRRDRQAHGRPRTGRRRHEPGAGAHRRARAARRAAVPVRGGGPAVRHRKRDAGVLRRRRRAVPRLDRAARRASSATSGASTASWRRTTSAWR